MLQDNPRSVMRVAGQPIHPTIVPFPIVCFVGNFIADIAYWRTADVVWATFSVWLLAIGLLAAILAVAVGLIDLLFSRGIRSLRTAWLHGLCGLVVLGLAGLNTLVHSRDGWTAVVPQGLILSGLTVLVLIVTGCLGGALVYRHRVGVAS